MKMPKIVLACMFSMLVSNSFAQSTWAHVYSLFQKYGCTSSCHDGTGSSTLDLYESGSMAAVYDNLINVDPTNPAAKTKHNKLVFPGVPELSFLLRKINNGFDENLAIAVDEGSDMPVNISPMSNRDIEVIRQWILYGAKESGNKVDTAIIAEYYNTYGTSQYFAGKRTIRPAVPDPTEGFQMHFGPIFLNPKTESEVNIKIPVFFDQDMDGIKIVEDQNYYSHHFILYQYDSQYSASNITSGIRTVDDFNDLSYADMIAAWAYDRTVELPAGTAYKWDATTYFDFNYHVPNPSLDSIMAAEVYLNIYTSPQSSSRQQMYSTLINYGFGGSYPFLLNVPNSAQDEIFTDETYDSGSSDSLYVWLLSSHTHKYGKDYDVYRRNADGTRGDQLYEGFYNEEYTFNQGYYNWEHPAVRYFDPLEPIAAKDGFIHEAVFNNYGDTSVGYGLTTEDEMMLFFLQYTLGPVDTGSSSGIHSLYVNNSYGLTISPNPANENVFASYKLEHAAQVTLEMYDVLGKTNKVLMNSNQAAGQYRYSLNNAELASGIYNVKLTVDNKSVSTKLVYTGNTK